MVGELLECVSNLECQLAGRRQHERLRRAVGFIDACEDRQRKGRRLAGTGLRQAHHVAPFHERGDSARLDGGRSFEANLLYGFEDV